MSLFSLKTCFSAGRLRVPQDLCNITMDNNCQIAMLLPSTTGLGVCSMSLLFFLVNTHDEFLLTYRSATNQERYRDFFFLFVCCFCWCFRVTRPLFGGFIETAEERKKDFFGKVSSKSYR